MPHSSTINKAESTNKIVFISFNRNVYTNQFTLELSTRLLNRERFTVTRKTRNERRIEKIGLNNFFNIIKVTKLDEGIIFIRNKVLFHSRESSRCLVCLLHLTNNTRGHFQIPTTTTSFVIFQTATHGLNVQTTRGTETFEIARGDFRTIQFFERFNQLGVVHRRFARHNVVRCVSFELSYYTHKKGATKCPL